MTKTHATGRPSNIATALSKAKSQITEEALFSHQFLELSSTSIFWHIKTRSFVTTLYHLFTTYIWTVPLPDDFKKVLEQFWKEVSVKSKII